MLRMEAVVEEECPPRRWLLLEQLLRVSTWQVRRSRTTRLLLLLCKEEQGHIQ